MEEELGWHLLAEAVLPRGAGGPDGTGGTCGAAGGRPEGGSSDRFPGIRGRLPCDGAVQC